MKILNYALTILMCALLPGLGACVSGSKRLAELDVAATHPPELDKLCREGLGGACALMGKTVVLGTPLSILQGVTSATQTRFTVMTAKKETRTYYVRGPGGIRKLAFERVSRDSSPMAVDHVEAFELNLKDKYELIVLDGAGQVSDRRNFRALDLKKKNPRLALASCMDDSLKVEQGVMWKQLLSDKPDVLLMIGDNVYADRIPNGWQVASAEQLWDRYVDTRSLLELYKSPNLVPAYATWDDHDYGRNDSDRTYALKDESAKVFQAFFAQTKASGDFTRGPGVASAWSAFGVRFLFLDDRSFRSPNRVDLADQTHFGVEQEDWIVSQISTSKEPVFMISGDQFFGGYNPFESYEGSHPKSFPVQLARWKKAKVLLVFVSGDRHLTEIIQVPRKSLGYQTYELTSSPIHASVFGDAFLKTPSPNQLLGVAGKYNYMLVDLKSVAAKSVRFDIQSRGLQLKTFFEKSLTVKK